jgi:hypothetical protein
LFLQLQLELISIEVSAKADLETFSGLLWWCGKMRSLLILWRWSKKHIPHCTGTYQVKIALSGGLQQLKITQSVIVTNLFAANCQLYQKPMLFLFSDSIQMLLLIHGEHHGQKLIWLILILLEIKLKYSNLNLLVSEATTTPINFNNDIFFHTDIWSSDLTEFKVKLVDFGADGTLEVMIKSMKLLFQSWEREVGGLDIPLSSFTGLTTLTYCSNYICWGTIRATTVYVDNVFFII